MEVEYESTGPSDWIATGKGYNLPASDLDTFRKGLAELFGSEGASELMKALA